MSAFIVSEETMHRVVAAIRSRPVNSAAASLLPFSPTDDPTLIGQLLFDMNWNAVTQRYGKDDDFFGVPTPYRWEARPATRVEQCKALSCLSYQCAEGDVPESALYQALRAIEEEIATELVAKMTPLDIQMRGEAAERENGQRATNADILTRTNAWNAAPWNWH